MTTSWQSLVPEHLHAAVHTGLSAVLDAKQIESVEPVNGVPRVRPRCACRLVRARFSYGLDSWLGRAADAALIQRLSAVRALTRLYYAGLLMAFLPSSSPLITDLSALTQDEFKRRISNGLLQPAAPETRIELAKMCLAGFLAIQ